MIANIEHNMFIYILPYRGTLHSRLTKPKLDVPTRYYILGTKPSTKPSTNPCKFASIFGAKKHQY